MAILDGNAYDAKCLEAGQERDEDLEACSLLLNNKQQALLVPSGAAAHNPQGKVIVQLAVGPCCNLPRCCKSWTSQSTCSRCSLEMLRCYNVYWCRLHHACYISVI